MIAVWFHTVFGFRSYHRLRQAGPWRTAFFAVYLLLVGVLIFNIYFAWQIHKQLPVFIKNFPQVTFEKGRLTVPDTSVSVAIPGTDYILVLDSTAKNPPSRQDFLDKKIILFVAADRFYMPSVNGVNSQAIPPQLDGVFDSQRLQQYAPVLRSLLQTILFFGGFVVTVLFLFFSILLAGAVVFFWSGLKHTRLPAGTVWRWAVFLQGPSLLLWSVQLIWGVPLFSFALFILFNIYVQQIFNTLPDK